MEGKKTKRKEEKKEGRKVTVDERLGREVEKHGK